MGGKKTENPCTALGCQAACCQNLYLVFNQGEFGKFTAGIVPDLVKVRLSQLTAFRFQKPTETKPKVYYAVFSDHHGLEIETYLHGRCPHLDSLNNCNIHDADISICRDFPVNNPVCQRFRREKGNFSN